MTTTMPRAEKKLIRLLIIDDQPRYCDLVKEIVGSSCQFQVVGTASSGRTGIELARSSKPDLVLADIHMPDLNGFEVARAVRMLCPDSKMVLISASYGNEIRDLVLEAGAIDYIPKSAFSAGRLLEAWEKAGS